MMCAPSRARSRSIASSSKPIVPIWPLRRIAGRAANPCMCGRCRRPSAPCGAWTRRRAPPSSPTTSSACFQAWREAPPDGRAARHAARLRLLGGVPRATGDWGKCDPDEPKNYRSRCGLLLQLWRRSGRAGGGGHHRADRHRARSAPAAGPARCPTISTLSSSATTTPTRPMASTTSAPTSSSSATPSRCSWMRRRLRPSWCASATPFAP